VKTIRFVLVPFCVGLFIVSCTEKIDSNYDQDRPSIGRPKSGTAANQAHALVISPKFPSQTLKPEAREQTVESYPKVVSDIPVRSLQMVSPSESPGSTASTQPPLPTRPPIPNSRLKAVPANK